MKYIVIPLFKIVHFILRTVYVLLHICIVLPIVSLTEFIWFIWSLDFTIFTYYKRFIGVKPFWVERWYLRLQNSYVCYLTPLDFILKKKTIYYRENEITPHVENTIS